MSVHKRHKKVHTNGALDKSIRFEVNRSLWDALSRVAEREGRKQGRPKSVSAVMRRVLQSFVEARGGIK